MSGLGDCVLVLKCVMGGGNSNVFFCFVDTCLVMITAKISFHNCKIDRSFVKIGEKGLRVAISDVKIHIRMCFDKTGKSRYDRIFANGHCYAKGQNFFSSILSCIRFFNVFSSFLMVSRAERKISPAGVSLSFFLSLIKVRYRRSFPDV